MKNVLLQYINKSQRGVFCTGIKAGTLLPWVEVVVAIDLCIRVKPMQVFDDLHQGGFLRQRPGVLAHLFLVGHTRLVLAASDVCHSNRIGVVASLLTVGTNQIDIAASLDVAVAVDDIVISNVAPALTLVVGTNLLHGVVAAFGCVCAMDDDFLDGASRLLQAEDGWQQQGNGGRANDAITHKVVLPLELHHSVARDSTVDAVTDHRVASLAQSLLEHLHAIATRANFIDCRHKSSLIGSMSSVAVPGGTGPRFLVFGRFGRSMTVSPVSMC